MNTVTISKTGMSTDSSDSADDAAPKACDAQPSRRSLVTRATAAVAGFGALLLIGTRTAHAENETMAVGQEYGDATSTTGVMTSSGFGLFGGSSDPAGAGVCGTSSATNPGVVGISTGIGPGVRASSSRGIALDVDGPVRFSRSGVVAIPKGGETVRVNLNGVTSASIVLATLQCEDKGTYLAGVVPGTNQFTVHLNGKAPESMGVGFFVIG